MIYSEYAVLSVSLESWHGEIEKDDLSLCSAMLVQLCMRKRAMGDEDENDLEYLSQNEKSGYDMPDLIWKTWYRCNYTPDYNLYLPHWGW
jgi:hypothetical protein